MAFFAWRVATIYPIQWLIMFCWLESVTCSPQMTGFRLEANEWAAGVRDDDRTYLYSDRDTKIRLFGCNFKSNSWVSFTTKSAKRGTNCHEMRSTEIFQVFPVSTESAIVTVNLPLLTNANDSFYFCIKEVGDNNTTFSLPQFIHQGSEDWLQIGTLEEPRKTYMMPLWLLIIMVIILLTFSGLFSGLNLGLMSLDVTELNILINSGSPSEKRFAKTIQPLRKRGNFLLCTILLGNVLVNNTLAILLDDLTGSGLAAILGATLAIVIFGEIIPQAICSRYGLEVGAKTIWFTKIFMVLTFPMSYPISRILDCVLGKEIGYVLNRNRLRELLKLTEKDMDLVKDEWNIITGALELSKKTVGDIMTRLEDVFMIEYSSILDFETMNQIMQTGYTRIPIYEKDRTNIVALLNIKDLAFVDPDEGTPLKTITKFYNHPLNFFFEDTCLDVVLQEFKKGRSHMAVVQKVNNEGPGDPYYETIGLVTLEDVIEEIIQSEIIDETDTVTDNRLRAPRKSHVKDFSVFNQHDSTKYPRLSPQLALATYQFLSTSVPPFKSELISELVLQRLIKQNVIVNFRLTDSSPSSDSYLYKLGKPCDYFIMILQGRVEVQFGKEALLFEGGPFVYFGVQALLGVHQNLSKEKSSTQSIISLTELAMKPNQAVYIPDYSVKATTDLQYLCIRRAYYAVALRATMLERQAKKQEEGSGDDDLFDKDWLRVLTLEQTKTDSDSSCVNELQRGILVNSLPDGMNNLAVKDRHCGKRNSLQNFKETLVNSLLISNKDKRFPIAEHCQNGH